MVTVLDAQILTQRRPAGTCRTLPGDYSHACSYFAREQGGPGWAEGGRSLCRRPLRAARRSRGNLARACEALPSHALGFLLTRFLPTRRPGTPARRSRTQPSAAKHRKRPATHAVISRCAHLCTLVLMCGQLCTFVHTRPQVCTSVHAQVCASVHQCA